MSLRASEAIIMSNQNQNQKVETLRWSDGHLELIDQRVLPKEFKYVRCSTAAEVAKSIETMVVRGAPAIGCAAAYGIALEAIKLESANPENFKAGMEEAFTMLAASRPTAVNLFWALKRMRAVWEKHSDLKTSEIANAMLEEAHKVSAEDIAINRSMGAYGAELIPDCNAGALATAGHGTALGVIRSTVEAGKKISVIADETRPFLQGARLTAWEMVQEGIPTTLISDGMAGHLMATGCIDVVVVGTDRVAANGDVANKIGTYMVAVLANRHKIPFYVACPLSTIDLSIANGSMIPIEERAASEVLGFSANNWAAEGVQVRNPSFDVTPADLVTGLITEQGVIFDPDENKIARLFIDA